MATKHEEIKTMKLYTHLDRIERRLRNAGADITRQIDPELLGTMDCLHFFADEPLHKIQKMIEAAGGANANVLDLGTGYGGSARLLAHRTGCHVDALELQPDLSAVAEELTKRCGLADRITHLTGDFLLRPIAKQQYDVIVGLLCFLHIGNWRELFTRCFDSLKPGGVLYVEDFYQRGEAFTDEDKVILKSDIYCAELLPQREFLELLGDIGFEIGFEDATTKWMPYVQTRAVTFRADLAKHIEADGEDAARALDHFYTSVGRVFDNGNLGGYMLTARRPAVRDATLEQP